MSAGGLASYTKGPLMVSRSWVPMATKDRFLEETKQPLLLSYRFPHTFSCPDITIPVDWA